jgi:hypothetical protein
MLIFCVQGGAKNGYKTLKISSGLLKQKFEGDQEKIFVSIAVTFFRPTL